MFDKIYNDSISKVKPDSELIEATKKMMQDEIKSKKVIKNISFYKYASIAACVVVVISVFAIYPKNIIRNLGSTDSLSTSSGSFDVEDNVYFEGVTINKDNSFKVQNSNSLDSFSSVNGDIGLSSSDESNSFIEWIKGIIQWFYELLF